MEKMVYRTLAEKHAATVLAVERHIWKHPETGFREWETSEYLARIFENAGYTVHRAGNIPGFYADADTGRPGPKILILGEMDCLLQPNHPDAVDGKAHSCGHNAQCAALVGVALALKEPGAMDGLCGSVRLMAVPAEELIEVEFRNELRDQGIIHYLGGKTEFLYRGYMDGCDMAFLLHAASSDETDFVCYDLIGCMAKEITYEGVAAHAGSSPHLGVNALYAASLGLQAVNSIRETFRDDDHIRVHPIITQGGSVVNTIPERVSISTFVRGKTLTAIVENNRKVSRALAGAAVSLGAKVSTKDRAGYSPLANSPALVSVACDVAEELFGKARVDRSIYQAFGSTDMGDLCCLMPAFQANLGGCRGNGHSDAFQVTNPEKTCVQGAVLYLLLTRHLLENDAVLAQKVLAETTPIFATKADYFHMIDQLMADRELVCYDDHGATVTY